MKYLKSNKGPIAFTTDINAYQSANYPMVTYPGLSRSWILADATDAYAGFLYNSHDFALRLNNSSDKESAFQLYTKDGVSVITVEEGSLGGLYSLPEYKFYPDINSDRHSFVHGTNTELFPNYAPATERIAPQLFLAASGNEVELNGKKYFYANALYICRKIFGMFEYKVVDDIGETDRLGLSTRDFDLTYVTEQVKNTIEKWDAFKSVEVTPRNDLVYKAVRTSSLIKSSVTGYIYFELLDEYDFEVTISETNFAVNSPTDIHIDVKYVYKDGSEVLANRNCRTTITSGTGATISTNTPTTISVGAECTQFISAQIEELQTGKTFLISIRVNNFTIDSSNPYLPQGGGISGGGAQSGSSNVIGSFDGTPGPSIVSGIPDGAAGSDVASSGMYTKYLCDAGILNVIAQYLWEDNVGIQALKAVIGNPIDSIISLISYPFALDSLVPITSTKIYFGKYNSLLSANSITKSSIKIDWGTVEIPFFWGGFLDYSPYTQIQLYLPWGVGFVSLDPNEVMPWSDKNSYTQGSFTKGSVSVVTNVELDKGSCVHNVIGNNGRVIASFGGICGKQVPVVGTNDAARTLALIGAAVSAGTTLGMTATGQPALGKGLAYGKNMSQMKRAEGREMLSDYNSAVSGMLASTRAAAKSPPTYPRAGTFSDATSHLAVQYPYLIISRPSQSIPKQYGRFMGYPSNIFHNQLGEVKGYTEVSSIHLDNIPATSTELDELESILKGGVLL